MVAPLARPALLLLAWLPYLAGLDVELRELLAPVQTRTDGEMDEVSSYWIRFTGSNPIDSGCVAGLCRGALTRDESFELDSRYGCTVPTPLSEDDDFIADSVCGVEYYLYDVLEDTDIPATIASIKVALHPDSTRILNVYMDWDDESTITWTADSSTTELQEIPGVAGLSGERLHINGDPADGEYLGILEVEIYVTVDDVPVTGASATDRIAVVATSATDSDSASATLDGNDSPSSAWMCSSESSCEITYDLAAVESVDQVRIDFVEESTTSGGTFNVYAAGEDGDFYPVLMEATAGQRAESTGTGLQTFGGVRALARYVKIEAVPASGGAIVISEVDIRVGEYAPTRGVAEKPWLKAIGMTPMGRNSASYRDEAASYDARAASEGGCSNVGPFEGCHVYYIKDGDDSPQSRWSCGPTVVTGRDSCDTSFSLHGFRYVRQIQFSFHEGVGKYNEFTIQASTKYGYDDLDDRWVTVLPSVITSGETPELQTFDLRVHTDEIRIIPKYRRIDEFINIKEMVVLERKWDRDDTLRVMSFDTDFDDDEYDESRSSPEATTQFKFILDYVGSEAEVYLYSADAVLSGVRMKFPKNRVFNFDITYEVYDTLEDSRIDVVESFSSAGGERQWETFYLMEPVMTDDLTIIATGGPDIDGYPALKVGDFEVIAQRTSTPGTVVVASTAIISWFGYVDIICDGQSDQEDIMTVICEAKGATYDGIDCVGDLNDSTLEVQLKLGDYYVDGPIYLKSGITLSGSFNAEYLTFTGVYLYNGPNTGSVAEEAMIVVDGVSNAKVEDIWLYSNVEYDGQETPGTVGNVCLEVKNSHDLELIWLGFLDCPSGGAKVYDSQDIEAWRFESNDFGYANGNMLSLFRTSNTQWSAFSGLKGLLVEDSNNVTFTAVDDFEIPTGGLEPPAGGDQQSNVVITGDSSGIIFKSLDFILPSLAEPRILVESTSPVTMDFDGLLDVFEDVTPGECLIEVPEGSSDSILVQIGISEPLTRSGNCYILEE